jgi:tripartite-type tricarboxylate transporter receptor subunit TctC
LFAPAGTPSAITEKLNKLAVSVVNDASFKTRVMDPMTISPGHETIPEMTQLMKSDRELGLALVKRAKVKLD